MQGCGFGPRVEAQPIYKLGRRHEEQLAGMRYKSKQALLEDIRTQHDVLCARLGEIPKVRWHESGVWGDGWTLSDLVGHLAEWQHLFLGWYEDGLRGATPQMPAPGYKWSETPRLNRAIWEKQVKSRVLCKS